MPEHIADRYPTAAKAHECQTCGMVIEPMTRYRRAFMRYDGQAYEWIEHIECGELGRLSRLYGYDEDGGYSTATVEDWLRDESAETAMAKTSDEAVKARIRAWFASALTTPEDAPEGNPDEWTGYGAFPGGDPRTFTPDPEVCSTAEIQAHADACREADEREARGEPVDLPGGHHFEAVDGGVRHVAHEPFGVGTYTIK